MKLVEETKKNLIEENEKKSVLSDLYTVRQGWHDKINFSLRARALRKYFFLNLQYIVKKATKIFKKFTKSNKIFVFG